MHDASAHLGATTAPPDGSRPSACHRCRSEAGNSISASRPRYRGDPAGYKYGDRRSSADSSGLSPWPKLPSVGLLQTASEKRLSLAAACESSPSLVLAGCQRAAMGGRS